MRFLLLLCLLLNPLSAAAQVNSASFLDTALKLELDPPYPSPQEQITVNLNDYGSTLYGAELSWYLNEKPIPDTTNQRSITIAAGAAGSVDTLKLVLKSPSRTEVITAKIEPLYLDIIVEPQTHVPSFYKGRPLASVGSTVNLTALLSSNKMLGTDYIYTWRVNQKVLEGGALRGRNKISFTTPQDTNNFMSLQVATPNGTVVAKRSIIIPSVKPQIHFYEVSTLFGTEERALVEDFYLVGNSITIKAAPYYLDSQTFNAPNILDWTVNNTAVTSSDENPYEITLEKTGYPGSAQLEFHVRSTTQLLQGVRGGIGINI